VNPVAYARADSAASALATLAAHPNGAFLAGGTTIVDLMKEGVETPDVLVDINALPFDKITVDDAGVHVGAMVRNSDLAVHPEVARRYPMLAEALLAGASGQLRNMATVGGNLMQRTRCPYFRNPSMPCNKREPQSGCSALDGYNRGHAILGTSPHCIATHPSDMAVALVALEAVVRTLGATGDERRIPIGDFHFRPGETPHIETALRRDELIIGLDIPPLPMAVRSHYVKVRDRASYEFALTSGAVALGIQNGVIREARIALGGVATKPWRATAAERHLIGERASSKVFAAAAEAALADAQPRQHNAFKVELAKRTLIVALSDVAGIQ
jgi:xanthine dehydrogenase YagS FAD-binding subunit